MIYTVTLNPSVDRTLTVSRLEPGQLHRVQSRLDNAGGKGLNVSRTLSKLDVPSTAIGFLGGDAGRWIERTISSLGILSRWIQISGETRMNIKVWDESSKLVTELNEGGPRIEPEEWKGLEELIRSLPRSGSSRDTMVFAGNPPKNSPVSVYRDLVAVAKEKGFLTVLDTNGAFLEAGLNAGPDVIKPNLDELASLVGQPIHDVESAAACAAKLVERGIRLVVVSMGSDGALYSTREAVLLAVPPQVEVKSTVGCGDALVAGTVFGLVEGLSLDECARWGAGCGTAAATTNGTEPGDKELTMDVMSRVQVSALR